MGRTAILIFHHGCLFSWFLEPGSWHLKTPPSAHPFCRVLWIRASGSTGLMCPAKLRFTVSQRQGLVAQLVRARA